MNAYSRVTIGEGVAETRAIQILSLALNQGAHWAGTHLSDTRQKLTIPALLHAAGKAMALGSLLGPETPYEIVALAARNTLELYLRLKHLLAGSENCDSWRGEAVTDQLEIYEGTLKLDMPEHDRGTLKAEIDRVRQHAEKRGLKATKLAPVRALARAAQLQDEYDAYYRVCSKFVHPSSFWVNWPDAASTPMYRTTFVFKLQLYGHLLLDELEAAAGLPVSQVPQAAEIQYSNVGTRPN
jgi:hypothetical protein